MKKIVLILIIVIITIFQACQKDGDYSYIIYMKTGKIIYAFNIDNDNGLTWICDEKGMTYYINTNDIEKIENCYNCNKK